MIIDLRIDNARVLTLDPTRPRARSLGLLGGRLCGLDEELEGARPLAVVDAGGATVVPGFHDAHCHTTSLGMARLLLDLGPVEGVADTLAAVAARARSLPEGQWVIAMGYGRGMAEGVHPTRRQLDQAGGGRPVWLTHLSGHACAVSSAVLAAAGIGAGSADPVGGRIGRDAAGEPDGVLYEEAADLVKQVVGPSPLAQLVQAIDLATAGYVTEGITAFTEAGVGCPGIDHSPVEVAAYQGARDAGVLRTRAQLMVWSGMLHHLDAHPGDRLDLGLDLGIRSGLGDRTLDLGAMKLWLDGAGTEGAGPDGHHGELVDDPGHLRSLIVRARRAGWRVAVHAMGDRAVDLALEALAAGPGAAAGDRIEHCALVRPDQLAAMAAAGVTAVPQPVFVPEFGDAFRHVFAERAPWSFRLASLLAAGIPVAASSDRPVTSGTPLQGIAAMVQRRTGKGRPYGPEEAVTATVALAASSRGGALAAGHGAHLGLLRRGYDADLAVLADDPTATDPSAIAAIEVRATVVDGAVVHDPHRLFDGWAAPGP